MGLFRKKAKPSGFRYCLKATELDGSHLFRDGDLTLAISRVSTWTPDALHPPEDALALGVVHDRGGSGRPLLPVSVEFVFRPHSSDARAGSAYVSKITHGDRPHYQMFVTIYDPTRTIMERFTEAFEHSVVSGDDWYHLVLRRERDEHIADVAKWSAATKARTEQIEAMLAGVESGDGELPRIHFTSIGIGASLTTKAPRWGYAWYESTHGPAFESKEISIWRSYQDRYKPAGQP